MNLILNIIFIFYSIYTKELIINNADKISSDSKYKINKRKLLKYNDIQRLNNFVSIYNPYEKVAYISNTKNRNGDLFITTNSEIKENKTRLVYALRKNFTNYFTDNEGSYKIMNLIINNLGGVNAYPLITSLIIDNEEYIVSLSHQGCFESLDYKNGFASGRNTNSALIFSTNVNKNTFTSLKYYNNSNIILNSYISKDINKNYFMLQKIFFGKSNINKTRPVPLNETRSDKGLIDSVVTCFEIKEFIECLYTNSEGYYNVSVFDILYLEKVYSKRIDSNKVTEKELYSKCIYFKDSIGIYIYYLSRNNKPKLSFLELVTPPSLSGGDFKLDNYLESITINSKSEFDLGYGYANNDIIKLNDKNIIFTSVSNNYEKIIIILIKLLNEDKNILINYYNIELKNDYNIKIYKDFTSFTINNFFGIGMINYNYSLSSSTTYSNYFIIGINSSNNITISEEIDIFDEDNIYEFKIKDININIENNIFGYYFYGIQLINILSENLTNDNLGFYLYSNNLDKKIGLNENVLLDDKINFKVIDNSYVIKDLYSIVYLPIISEANFTDYISFPDSIENFVGNIDDLEDFYHSEIFFGKTSYINFYVNNCYKTCQTCSYYGNHINHYCETCSINYPYNKLNNFNNCYAFISNETNILTNEDISTKVNIDNTQDISSEIQENFSETSQNYVKECEIKELFIKECTYSEFYSKENKDLFKEIKKSFEEHFLNELLENLIETKEDLILEEKNIVYQITTSDNQNNKIYYNLSTIKLGKCEQILKDKNNLTENESLIIFKIENHIEGYNIPLIDYEVYNPRTKNKINLNSCKNEQIDIFHPVTIDENELFKYDPESEFYNDICYPYTTKEKTDIILNDRRKEFLENKLTLCENNCKFNGYNSKLQSVYCKCNIKEDLLLIFNSNVDIQKLRYNFADIKNQINIKVMKCYYLLFTVEGISNNMANYILLIIIFLYTTFSVIFCIKGYNKLILKIKEIEKQKMKKKLNSKNNNIKKIKTQINSKNQTKQNLYNIKMTVKNPIKKKKVNINCNDILNEKTNLSNNSNIKFKLNKSNKSLNYNINKILKNNVSHKESLIKNSSILNYNDYEINRLSYKIALKYDKRSYFQYYYSLLKTNHPLIFSFFPSNDYNSPSIKICLFLFSFALYFGVNSLFFTDKKMHVIYVEKGIYLIINELPITIYSSFISIFLNMIIRYLSLTQNDISDLKKIKQFKAFLIKSQNLISFIKRKFIFFFIISYILLILFWYYLACFCAVYRNTQIQLIKNTFISFNLSFLYYFGLYLLPGVFRIIALKDKKKNKKCLYKLSIILQIL